MSQVPVMLYSAAQVGELDRRVIEDYGVPGFDLMQRAAAAAFASLRRHWPEARSLAVFCGPGNNGGDGFLVAKQALETGLSVRLFFLGRREQSKGDAAEALAAFEAAGGRIEPPPERLPEACDVIVDAMLGTGLGRDVEGRYAEAVALINAAAGNGIGVFAVDIPSGLDADTGKVWGVAVVAEVTATFIGRKLGLFTGKGPAHAGDVDFDDLGAPPQAYVDAACLARLVDAHALHAALPRRPRDAHKGRHGHLLCVGGNYGMGGAVRMAGEAALRSGAGLVSVATRATHVAAMTQARPELMCSAVEDQRDLEALLVRADVAAVGPGLGQDAWARALFARMLESDLPLVVDADALNLLAAEPAARGNWILTPHPGEAARLLDTDTAAVQSDRPAAAAALAERFAAVVVLKGAGSLIRDENDLWLCAAGNPGMAVGGMGDVLTGVVAGLRVQGLDAAVAARVGAYLHAAAADQAAAEQGERGLLPTDLFTAIRHLANPR